MAEDRFPQSAIVLLLANSQIPLTKFLVTALLQFPSWNVRLSFHDFQPTCGIYSGTLAFFTIRKSPCIFVRSLNQKIKTEGDSQALTNILYKIFGTFWSASPCNLFIVMFLRDINSKASTCQRFFTALGILYLWSTRCWRTCVSMADTSRVKQILDQIIQAWDPVKA